MYYLLLETLQRNDTQRWTYKHYLASTD